MGALFLGASLFFWGGIRSPQPPKHGACRQCAPKKQRGTCVYPYRCPQRHRMSTDAKRRSRTISRQASLMFPGILVFAGPSWTRIWCEGGTIIHPEIPPCFCIACVAPFQMPPQMPPKKPPYPDRDRVTIPTRMPHPTVPPF